MRKIATALAIAAVAATAWAGSATGARAADTAGMERHFVALLNELRSAKSLPALAVHPELVDKARGWSATMAAEGRIWHSELSDGVDAPWYRLGENVGMGGSVQALHDALVESPSHYTNLVDPGFTHVGMGVVLDGDGTIFVSQVFMEMQPAATTPPAPAPRPTESGATQVDATEVDAAGAAAGPAATPTPPSPSAPPAPPTTQPAPAPRFDRDSLAAAGGRGTMQFLPPTDHDQASDHASSSRHSSASAPLGLAGILAVAVTACGLQSVARRRIVGPTPQ